MTIKLVTPRMGGGSVQQRLRSEIVGSDCALATSRSGGWQSEVMMKVSLEYIADSPVRHTFRVAFHSATERCLLPYPKVTGLTFTDRSGNKVGGWKTRLLVSEPLDDFVLNPRARIAFDIYANINGDTKDDRWVIELPPSDFQVYFAYHVDRETDWYDFLAKRSRFAAVTPIWRGSIHSNTIPFRLET